MVVKLKDIAKMANVSEATASLALNDSDVVKDETRKKIKKIAKELGYSPNAIARGLAKRKSETIGVIVPDIESAYYGKLVRFIDEYARKEGFNPVLAISNDDPNVEKNILNNFISQRVEGIIITPINRPNRDLSYLKNLDKIKIPYIFVTAHYPEIDSSYVMVDLEEGTYMLAKYLLDLGHRNIIMIGGSREVISTDYRVKGYIRAFEERNIKYSEKNFIECKRLNYEQAFQAANRLVKDGTGFDAIITINDMMALGVINALRENQISVPQEVSVAGYDNVIFSVISPVPITTVNQDIAKMSWSAVNMLVNKINRINVGIESILIKPELIIRESTDLKNKFL